jgi:hypothetical protein
MKPTAEHEPCRLGCNTTVPKELETENLCVQHFLLGVEQACSEIRREATMERATTTRRQEIDLYIRTTAIRLSEVATGNRLSDDLKKRVLTTFLTLMNLQESVERCTARFVQIRPPQRSITPPPLVAGVAG